MVYDIYKLSGEVESIVSKPKGAGEDIREIANQLELALNTFLSDCNDSLDQEDDENTCDAGKLKQICEDSSCGSNESVSCIVADPLLK